MFRIAVCACALIAIPAVAAHAADAPAGGTLILGADSYWRWHDAWRRPVTLPGADGKRLALPTMNLDTPAAPADWAAVAFEAADWPRARLTELQRAAFDDFATGRVCLRGRFQVDDPAAVRSLHLAITFRGGVVVMLNGREVARSHMPAGPVAAGTPAEPYPDEVFLDDAGKILLQPRGAGRNEDYARRVALRNRSLDAELPTDALVKGLNCLAVAVHRSDYHPVCTQWFQDRYGHIIWNNVAWVPCNIGSIELTAAGGGVVPNAGRPAGVHVWTVDVNDRLNVLDHAEAIEPIRPIERVAVRNGFFNGRIVVGSDKPIRGLKAVAGELTRSNGGGAIPASAVRTSCVAASGSRYGVPDWYDGLLDEMPAEIKANAGGGAMAPIWVTIAVPADAAAGEYRGAVTVSAAGLPPTEVPIRLNVLDWTLPAPKDWRTHVGVYESPTSVAMQYGVPMWSDRHWELVERSLALLGQLGNKHVNVPVVRHTQMGNDEGMIRWIRRPDGKWDYDFTVFDRYMALVAKYMVRPRFVALQIWHAAGWGTRAADQKNEVTVLDPATGATTPLQVPVFGTDASAAFWKPVLDAIRGRLAKLGMAGTMCIGILSDGDPPPEVSQMFGRIAPDMGWHRGTHVNTFAAAPVPLKGGGGKVVCWEYVYGPKHDAPFRALPKLPEIWKYQGPGIRFYRGETDGLSLQSCRTMAERGLYTGSRGFGRICLDFYPVIKIDGKPDVIYNRWPESSCAQREPSMHQIAWAAPAGPAPTERFEIIREGIQEAEAMMLVSYGLQSEAGLLGSELAGECRRLFADRITYSSTRYDNAFNKIGFATDHLGWEEQNERLFRLAAEVSAKLTAAPRH